MLLIWLLGSKATVYKVFVSRDDYAVDIPLSLEYTVGYNTTLFCITSPTSPVGSVFRWSCHGCSFDMKIGQAINIELELADSGDINCSVIVDEVEYTSKIVELRVLGKYFPILWSLHH